MLRRVANVLFVSNVSQLLALLNGPEHPVIGLPEHFHDRASVAAGPRHPPALPERRKKRKNSYLFSGSYGIP